jgi:hypothetical protein
MEFAACRGGAMITVWEIMPMFLPRTCVEIVAGYVAPPNVAMVAVRMPNPRTQALSRGWQPLEDLIADLEAEHTRELELCRHVDASIAIATALAARRDAEIETLRIRITVRDNAVPMQ